MTRITAALFTALSLFPADRAAAQLPPPSGTVPVVPEAPLTLTRTVFTIGSPKSHASDESFNVEPVLDVALESAPTAAAAFDESGAYLPLKSGRFVAVDLDSGTVRWSRDLSSVNAPAVSGGLVLVAGDELLSALDAKTGEPQWSVAVPGGFSAPPLGDSGWVVAVSADGDVFTIRASDGRVLWTRSLGTPAAERPFIAADGVYFSLSDNRVVALALLTGEPRWERTLPGRPGPLLVLDDRLFVGATDKFFYCLNTRNGKRRWRWRTGGRPAGAAAVDEERVYYVALDNILWALDRGNGVLKWRDLLPVRPAGGPIVLGNVVVVAAVAFEVYGYLADTGAAIGKAVFKADLAAPPQVIAGVSPALASLAAVTKEGNFRVLRRRVEPTPIPMPYPFGEEIPLTSLDSSVPAP
jgi:outer membrane protein assembly factor BamB